MTIEIHDGSLNAARTNYRYFDLGTEHGQFIVQRFGQRHDGMLRGIVDGEERQRCHASQGSRIDNVSFGVLS